MDRSLTGYFAYGSNMLSRQMRERCPSARVWSRAALPDYRLEFVQHHDGWGGGVAGIVPDAGARVEGVIYRLTDADLLQLDAFEPVPEGLYSRERVEAMLPDGRLHRVWTYIGVLLRDAPFRPSKSYLTIVIDGALEHGLPAAYIAALQRRCRSG